MIASLRGKKNARISRHNFETNGRPYLLCTYVQVWTELQNLWFFAKNRKVGDFSKATCEICKKNRQSDDFNFLITCVFSQFFAILMITKVKATSGFYNICEQVWRGFFGSIAIFCSSVFHVNDHFDLSRCWFYKIYEKKRKITSQTIFLLFWQFLVIVIKAYLHAKANAAP